MLPMSSMQLHSKVFINGSIFKFSKAEKKLIWFWNNNYRMDTFTLNNGKLYCMTHFKQLFIKGGDYERGFGSDPHKNKWPTVQQSAPIAVSNGNIWVS